MSIIYLCLWNMLYTMLCEYVKVKKTCSPSLIQWELKLKWKSIFFCHNISNPLFNSRRKFGDGVWVNILNPLCKSKDNRGGGGHFFSRNIIMNLIFNRNKKWVGFIFAAIIYWNPSHSMNDWEEGFLLLFLNHTDFNPEFSTILEVSYWMRLKNTNSKFDTGFNILWCQNSI